MIATIPTLWLIGRDDKVETLKYGAFALGVLERAGLVHRTVVGRTHVCRLNPDPLAGADEWLRFYERYWTESLDALSQMFRDDETNESGDHR